FAFTPYNPVVYVGTMLASCAFLGVLVAPPLLRRGQRAQLTDLSAAAICTVVSSPVAWEHHYGILLPLYLVAMNRIFEMPKGFRRGINFAVLLVSWILVADFIPFTALLVYTPLVIFQASCFFGALLLLGQFLSLP